MSVDANPRLEIDPELNETGNVDRLRSALEKATEFGNDWRLRIANVRRLHPKSPYNSNICEKCFEPYPCSTIRACDGVNE